MAYREQSLAKRQSLMLRPSAANTIQQTYYDVILYRPPVTFFAAQRLLVTFPPEPPRGRVLPGDLQIRMPSLLPSRHKGSCNLPF